MELARMGDGAWRLELPQGKGHADVLALLASLPRVVDVVVADRHALVTFDPASPPEDPRPALLALAPAASAQVRLHVIRVRYDGPDLDDVARAAKLTRDEVIDLHAREYGVELVGFLPGFAYLGPLDERL